MTRAQLKQLAKQQIKGNIGILFLCAIICSLIGTFANILPAIGSILLIPVISYGLTLNYMAVVAGQKATVGRLFEGFNSFGRVWCMNFLRGLFVCLWSLLFYIPGYIKMLAYSFAPFILADNPDMSARQSIKESKRMTKGHKGDLFVLYLSFFPWYLLGFVTLGLAYIYVAPYMSATLVNYYNSLKGGDAVSAAFSPEADQPSYGSAPTAVPFASSEPESPEAECVCDDTADAAEADAGVADAGDTTDD